MCLRLIHKAVRSSHNTFNGLIRTGNGTSNAYRELDSGISRYGSCMDPVQNLLQSVGKLCLFHIGNDQKKFIPAVTNQNIGLTNVSGDHLGYCGKGHIACLVSICIIIDFKIIHINHGDPDRCCHLLDPILVIAAIIYTGQRILIQLFIISAQLLH